MFGAAIAALFLRTGDRGRCRLEGGSDGCDAPHRLRRVGIVASDLARWPRVRLHLGPRWNARHLASSDWRRRARATHERSRSRIGADLHAGWRVCVIHAERRRRCRHVADWRTSEDGRAGPCWRACGRTQRRMDGGLAFMLPEGSNAVEPRRPGHSTAPRTAYFGPGPSGRRDPGPPGREDGRQLSYTRGGLFAPSNLFVIDMTTGRDRQVTSFTRGNEGGYRTRMASRQPASGGQLRSLPAPAGRGRHRHPGRRNRSHRSG